jgi:hypothetical protein
MGELSANKALMLRALIDSAPDGLLLRLDHALSDESVRHGPLGQVWTLVDRESQDRAARNAILSPIVGLFSGSAAVFPSPLLGRLWRFLKTAHPREVERTSAMTRAWTPDEPDYRPYDEICALARRDILEDPDCLGQITAEQADRLVMALALAPIVRRCLPHLGDWIARMDPERRAAARLGYRDSGLVAPDAGPLYFQMLAARLAEPRQVLRIIAAVMDRPNERYLAGSELASFAEGVLDSIERQLAAVRGFDPRGGDTAGREAGRAVHHAALAIAELEEAVQLDRNGAWGQRVTAQRRGLANSVEARLKEIEPAVGQALPVQAIRYSARLIRAAPKLVDDPDPAAVQRVRSLLAFADEVRSSADSGGFGSIRAKVLENLEKYVDPYVEDVLDLLRSADNQYPQRARAYLEVAADILTLAKNDKSGQIVRRRLAAA